MTASVANSARDEMESGYEVISRIDWSNAA
jgi:hypothetical protein